MDTNGYSLSDIAAVANENSFGGNNGLIYILLFAMIFGGGFGNWGNRGGDYAQYATAASQQDILFGQKFSDLDNKIDRIGNGLADVAFSLNNSIKDGNAGVAGTVVAEGRAAQAMIQQNRFDMSNYASAISQKIDCKFAELEKNQLKAQIDNLSRENGQLYMAQQMCGVVRYPNSWAYNAGQSPFCNCNTNCGCGNGNVNI